MRLETLFSNLYHLKMDFAASGWKRYSVSSPWPNQTAIGNRQAELEDASNTVMRGTLLSTALGLLRAASRHILRGQGAQIRGKRDWLGAPRRLSLRVHMWVLNRFSCVRLCATPQTLARQACLSIRFSRQEYWSGLLCPLTGDLPSLGIRPTSLMSPALAGWFFTTSTTWKAPDSRGYLQDLLANTA